MKKLFYIVMAAFLVFGLNPLLAAPGDEVSTLQNPAQAQKAENLAAETEDVQVAQTNVNDAETALSNAQAAYDADPTAATEAALEEAQTNFNSATTTLSEVSGVAVDDITTMRTSGMGWGEIAHEIGVHPSVLGLRNSKKERTRARTRDMENFSAETSNGKALGIGGLKNANKGKGSNSSGKSNGNGNGKGGSKR
ncbi:MAG: hypothetical protein U9R16_01885 [Campylobacterota bacterium]|nr:hypothetical protein [Campylobacterota bacterium]